MNKQLIDVKTKHGHVCLYVRVCVCVTCTIQF